MAPKSALAKEKKKI
jgi:hypothetical protein